MPISNLSKIFGPTVVGYSKAEPDVDSILCETFIQTNVSTKTEKKKKKITFLQLEISHNHCSSFISGYGTFLEHFNRLLVQFYQ